ncbi:MAG: mechanosensitive ion channel domain-containing protein [candidate division Zixibacteria bacterium]
MSFKLFELNQTPVTVSSIVIFVIILLLFVLFSNIFNRKILKNLLIRSSIDQAIQYTIIRVGHYLLMIIGSIVAFQFVGIDLSGLAVIFGLLSVGIGFGLQNITSNFVAGLILLFERPIKIGDRVVVGETEGDVIDINMRATTILTLNNIAIIVPNSDFISSNVVNWSYGDPKIRLILEVGVSYDSDLDLVLKTLREAADEHPEVLDDPQPDVLLDSFGDSSWNMKLRVWIKHPMKHYLIRSEINCSVVRKFRENNIEIPFPQRDLHLRSSSQLEVRSG